MRRTLLTLTLASLLTCDSPTVAPPDLPGPAMDGETQASADQSVTITLSPPAAYLEKDDTVRFVAIVVEDSDTLDVDVAWFVSDTLKAQVDAEGLVTAREDGFAVLVAMWGGGLGAAALVVDTPPPVVVTVRSAYSMQSTSGGRFIAGRPILVRQVLTADQENDWEPDGIVEYGLWPWAWYGDPDTVSMIPPAGGIPVELAWDDWSHLDSSFHAIIPGDSVRADSVPRLFVIDSDWNADDDDYPFSLGQEVVEVPDFHLVIVPVIWDSIPDYRILEWTEGLTADSFRIIHVVQILPVRPGYQVTVLDPLTTQQDLTNYGGWSGLLNEIDSIRIADGRPAYFYGAIVPPDLSAVGGMARLGYPVSTGALWAMAHELGHNMGLLHAPCGGPGQVDSEYPYEDGRIGRGGFDFFWNKTLKDPGEFHDVMSYCWPWWISDYHLNKALTYRLEQEARWWSPSAADLERPPIIADPLDSFPLPAGDPRR